MLITERIKEKASKMNHTFASIERELEFANGSIRKWDTSSPASDKLLKVANLLNVSVDWLLTGKGDPRPTTESTHTPETKQQQALSEIAKMLLKAFESSDDEGRYSILSYAFKISNQEPKNTQQPIKDPIQDDECIATATTIDSTINTNIEDAENEDDLWIEKEVEAYKQALQLKANLKMSSAS